MASLTDMGIRAIRPPEKGQKTYFDDALQGFSVRVSQSGTKTFIVIYGTARCRISIGTWPVLPLAKARQKAKGIQFAQDHDYTSAQLWRLPADNAVSAAGDADGEGFEAWAALSGLFG